MIPEENLDPDGDLMSWGAEEEIEDMLFDLLMKGELDDPFEGLDRPHDEMNGAEEERS